MRSYPIMGGKKTIGCKWPMDLHKKKRLITMGYFLLDPEQLNVKTTFLHGDLDEEIYIYQLGDTRLRVKRVMYVT